MCFKKQGFQTKNFGYPGYSGYIGYSGYTGLPKVPESTNSEEDPETKRTFNSNFIFYSRFPIAYPLLG